MSPTDPSRGDVWLADLNPTRGHEQAGRRPVLIISADVFNHGPAGMAIAVPLTTRSKSIRSQIQVTPPEGGLREISYIKCEDIRSISKERLLVKWGSVRASTLDRVGDIVKILLDLP